jgi:hypothetical protein
MKGKPQPTAINLGPREISKRRLLGIVSLALGVGLAFVLFVLGMPRLTRLVVFFPIWMAGLGLFQAREQTCIALAARGMCNMGRGEEQIEDQATVAALRLKARRINQRALITAAIVTLVTLVFPG